MSYQEEPIAVVGSACRFPGGASSPSKLWELLHHPKDVLKEFPKDRLNLDAFHHVDGEYHGRTDVCNKGYLLDEDIRHFDTQFFNLSPAEADSMDPQQRLTMEVVYESVETAGYTLEGMRGSPTSVYLGVMTGDWHDVQMRDPESINRYFATGSSKAILSNRVSYFFDFRGPSMTIDTACSSSLAAVHLAVKSLRDGESKFSIACGVNLIFDAGSYVTESKLHMLSPTSRSRMWDAAADGYARGEGVSAVVLKTLSQAIADGDHIECIIRETGMNSDGRTTGITMPSSDAQSTLIKRTYKKAGLDPLVDRPQYFECHGTGTLAGDPVEARAVRQSFFPQDALSGSEKLYCGSIKTVIGHTEGCAGLAGLLKASLAVQNGVIPPNLLFTKLNPAIESFYDTLQVPTAPIPWPNVSNGPRRTSVNSFGFGGTNVHAIVENYIPATKLYHQPSSSRNDTLFEKFVGPLTLSAENEASLCATVKNIAKFIHENPSIKLDDLAFITQTRRTAFSTRVSFSGETRSRLLEVLDSAVDASEKGVEIGVRVPSSSESPAILGVFTGQGAQWAAMGRTMIKYSHVYRTSIENCEKALRDIPNAPEWSLMEELIATEEKSRINEAAISQPLCTATQIAIIEVLCHANIRFNAVVGHSSGEIGAAYAAGVLSLTDAMRVAYYRGLHAKLASSGEGKKGSMMAVGLGHDEVMDFCQQFDGRIRLAASNSPSSSTISGDVDAIFEAKELLDKENVFARLLKVDTAYHSHHMLKCSEPYLASLKSVNILANRPSNDCVWVSSVYGNVEFEYDVEDLEQLQGQYWVDNMVKPVLFSEAIECSLWKAGPFNLALEIGPHPALKGPATQTMKTALASTLPYSTLLERGHDDIETFSSGVGYAWTYLNTLVDFAGYRTAVRGPDFPRPRMLKNLPSYPWNHGKIHWTESRPSRRYRLSEKPPHEILGRRVGDDSDTEMRWRNFLKPDEIPWVRGHVFQGQILFPTTGYMAMAIQAGMEVAGLRPVQLVEIRDLVIPRACTLEEGKLGTEFVFSLKRVDSEDDESIFVGEFSCFSCPSQTADFLEKNCYGTISINFGEATKDTLPPRAMVEGDIMPVDIDEYYSSLTKIGLDYQGVFRGIKTFDRRMGYARAKASWSMSDVGDQYVIHPGPLDVGFHSIIGAFCNPHSGSLWAPYLPIKVDRLALIPNVKYDGEPGQINFDVDAFITKTTSNSFEGDVHIISSDGQTGIQAEGITLKLFTEAHSSDDRPMFSKTVWRVDKFSSSKDFDEIVPDAEELALAEIIDRTSLFWLRKVFDPLTESDITGWKPFHQSFFYAAKAVLQETKESKHPTTKADWLNDSEDTIMNWKRKYSDQADLKLIHAVGSNLLGVMTSDTQLLEVMLVDDMLSGLYTHGRAMQPLNKLIAELMEDITFKFPRLDILEIGAGTGGTTNSVLKKIGDAYNRYTYTDVSAGFFEAAKNRFSHARRLDYKVLDIERDPTEQGFLEGSHDVILASNVLHATRSLKETMKNVRKLLKPGGYLLIMEVTGEYLQLMLLMGGLPGWWLGVDEGRTRGPGINLTEWDTILCDTGFSGADKYVSDLPDKYKHACSVIVSQAIDNNVRMLQDPLTFVDELPLEERLVIVGGKNLKLSRTVKGLEKIASRFTTNVLTADSIDSLTDIHLVENTSYIVLSDLEKPVFSETVNESRLKNMQRLFSNADNVLWVTSGRLQDNPYANMSVGLGRALITELPNLNLQYLDITDSDYDSRFIVEMFLKLKLHKVSSLAGNNMLWCTEPEIAFRDNLLEIPRVILDEERNNRLNSLRRTITKKIPVAESPVIVSSQHGSLVLEQTAPWLRTTQSSDSDRVTVTVDYSISLPYSGSSNYVLSSGKVGELGSRALCLSKVHISEISGLKNQMLAIEGPQFDPELLRIIATCLTANALLAALWGNVVPDSSVIIFGASLEFAQALKQLSSEYRFVFVTTSREESTLFTYIHPQASARAIRQALPKNVGYAFDLASTGNEKTRALLSELYPFLKFAATNFVGESVRDLLDNALSAARSLSVTRSIGSTLSLENLSSMSAPSLSYPHVVDWTECEVVKVNVRPINGDHLFSAEKTYLMVGLVSDLGRSIVRWMVDNGAKYIVLTSRTARVDEQWLREIEASGPIVKVYKMDVSNRHSVQSVVDIIRKEMPPIAGVCNGALVLHDQLFVEMKPEALNEVFAPKVAGTLHLHEVFSEPDLDFFISFSSMSSVVGNAGQSNYNAASLFQAALTNSRRAQGLAGSVMSLGMVADVGYIARRGASLMERLKKVFYMPISETDAHLIFAEAVAASRPNNVDDTIEMASGIQPFTYTASTKSRPPWSANPRFSHFVRQEDESKETQNEDMSNVPVRDQMDATGSEEEAAAALLSAFANKLETLLQISPGSLNVDAPLLDVGIDSLLGVEIRTWFLKQAHVDVPVLKVLGGDNARTICADAANKYLTAKMAERASEYVSNESDSTGESQNNSDIFDVQNIDAAKQPASYDASSVGDEPETSTGATSVEFDMTSEMEVPKKQELERIEKMSFAQSRLWFQSRLSKDTASFNSVYTYEIKGKIHIPRLKRAVAVVVNRHDALRTCFFRRPSDGEPVQGLLKNKSDVFEHIPASSDEALQYQAEALRNRNWRLVEGDNFKLVLISRSPEHHFMIVAYHHIVMDGVSLHLFLKELNATYVGNALSEVPKQYMDLSIEERKAITRGDLDRDIEFWMEILTPLPPTTPLLEIARVKARQASDSYLNNESFRDLGADVAERIKKASANLNVTPFHFYMAGIQVLMNRLLGVEDLCIGILDANRSIQSSRTIGFFLNLIPLRVNVKASENYADIVKRTSLQYYNAQRHNSVPFDLILERLGIHRNITHTPLFQIVVNYRQGNFSRIPLGSSALEFRTALDAKSPYDLAFSVTPTDGTCYLQLVSNSDLYSKQSTDLLLEMLSILLVEASRDAATPLSSYSVYPRQEVDQAVTLGRGPRHDFGWPKTLTERFDTVSNQFGDHIAVKDADTVLTYTQLSVLVSQIANLLLDRSPRPNLRVAVLVEPSIFWVASMLAILRIGGVFVPLDPTLPDERLAAIVEKSAASILLCGLESLFRTKSFTRVDIINIATLPEPCQIPVNEHPGDPTFILFTSGSTGVPKGIMLSQAGFINYAASKGKELSLGCEVVLQQSALGFDMAIAQACIALMHGGTLVIAQQCVRGDPIALAKLMFDEEVSFTLGTPTEYLMVLRYGGDSLRRQNTWKVACSGGEAVTKTLKAAFHSLYKMPILVDCYGPTEISCCATMRKIDLSIDEGYLDGNEDEGVGKANPNTQIYVVDDAGKLLPTGFPGEIVIGGIGVAIGYLDEELSQKRFIPNIFSDAEDNATGGTAIYKTGDRGLLKSNGSLVFRGRIQNDTMVKLPGGLRVDLDEVASTIIHQSRGSIIDAVVTVRGDPPFLVAHVVLSTKDSIEQEALQDLANTLPLARYMKPKMIIPLDQIPMSSNGKIDRKRVGCLSLPSVTIPSHLSQKPLSLAEGELRILWDSVLPQLLVGARFSSDSDFFEVGGTSLSLVKLQASIRSNMGVSMPLVDLYHNSTLGGMAELISCQKKDQHIHEVIDWDSETALPLSFDMTVNQHAISQSTKDLEILLTGSTSFLGRHIVHSLVKNPNILKIHCIGVAPDLEESHPKSDRIAVYTGSLSEPRFGLSDDIYAHLQDRVDRIILAGSQGHCLNNYFSLRKPNVQSTRQMGLFALPRRIPTHYISSSRVTLLNPEAKAALPPVSVAQYKPSNDGSEGFTSAKWASEVILERLASATFGHNQLSVTIHRPCAVVGDKAPLEDALNALLRFSQITRAVPDMSTINVDGYFDFKSVDVVAEEIVATVIDNASPGVTYRHHSSGKKVLPSQFRAYMEEYYGGSFKEVPLETWIQDARTAGLEELIIAYLQAITEKGEKMIFPFLGMTK
nr:FunA [Talaromyces coalescens]